MPGAILLCGLLVGVALVVRKVDPPVFVWLTAVLVTVWAFQRQPRRPFAADGQAFTAYVDLADVTAVAVWLSGCLPAAVAALRRTPEPATIPGALLLAMATVWFAGGVRLWLRPPVLALTPDGVAFRTVFRSHRVRWDDMAAPVTAKGRVLTLGRPRMRITTTFFSVDPRSAAAAIEYYRTHPDERAEIGTPGEHERLRRVLAGAF
jgi:hypothetical protein